MLSFSARSAFALAVALSAAGCSNPVGPESSDPVGPAFSNSIGQAFSTQASPALSQNASASNEQKCDASPAAQLGAANMVANPGQGRHVEAGMGNAAQNGLNGMGTAVGKSACPE
jgi:hypothetical protein